LGKEEGKQVMEEAHAGVCGAHQSGPNLHKEWAIIGPSWCVIVPASLRDVMHVHANFIHQPLEPLHPTIASWHFEA